MKYSITSKESTNGLYFESKITQEESTKVLNTLNESDPIQLSRYKISQSKIKDIEKWKNKKGPFHSLGDILEIDGFSENMLNTICKNIINENIVDNNTSSKSKSVTASKRVKHIVTPPLNGLAEELNSATGIHLSPIGISWARLSLEGNKLTKWSYEDFSSIPKKMLPTEIFLQAIDVVKRIPPSDVYIFESTEPLSPTRQVATVSSFHQQIALTSMLLALLNTSMNHNASLRNVGKDNTVQSIAKNRVFFLKPKLPARLFETLIGKEKVSTLSVVNELMQNYGGLEWKLKCEPITVEEALKNSFSSYSSSNKELMGQALLLVVSFMNLCVLKNPKSLKAVNYNKTVR
ncbi:transcription elongation factor, mitochondrial isoform X2 [Leptinotarsa decemlineata]